MGSQVCPDHRDTQVNRVHRGSRESPERMEHPELMRPKERQALSAVRDLRDQQARRVHLVDLDLRERKVTRDGGDTTDNVGDMVGADLKEKPEWMD